MSVTNEDITSNGDPKTTFMEETSHVPLELDMEAIEKKNLEERNKRMNANGIFQFQEATGKLAHFAADIWGKETIQRENVDEDVDVLIVGGGFGGILAAIRLREQGITNIRIVDKASDYGGVWYWNRYPGLFCDTEAYIYLPMLEYVNHTPTMKYVPGSEIQSHALALAEKAKLRAHTLFQTEINAVTWNEETGRWAATTTRGDKIRARFIVSAIGILHKLHLPGIPGVEEFEGHTFHTSRWDYDYTGGDRYGAPLSKLKGKRVGLVGTGASTLQVLPHLGASGAEVYVFQRTPTAVDQRINPKTDDSWYSSLKPGWQDERADNFEQVFFGMETDVDMINDGWTKHTYALHAVKDGDKSFQERLKVADNLKMEEIRQRTERIVKDKATADGLKAWYGRTCKRPGFHNEYLPTFNLPNVHLVDTDGKGVERVTAKGAVAAGKETPLDCIIYATGFDWGNDYSARANMTITGRNGRNMSDKWDRGPSTFQGMIGRDFPNLLIFSHLQSSTSPNYTHLLSERSKHAAYIISEALKRKTKAVEPTQEAEDAWVKKLEDIAIQYLDHFKQCTPGYLNSEGGLSEKNLRNASVGLTGPEWYRMAEDWRASGKLEGLELTAW